jgi:hypothetical protein
MRSTTTKRLAAILGMTVALAVSGVPQSAAAQTSDTQKGSTQHSKPTKHEPPAHSAHARAPQQPQSINSGSDNSGLPGYSARPAGMCWAPGGGGGQDLSGSWGPCKKR